jgi:hypothetical protein
MAAMDCGTICGVTLLGVITLSPALKVLREDCASPRNGKRVTFFVKIKNLASGVSLDFRLA